MAQQFADEVVPDAMAGIEYSSGTTVTFAPGENEKTVKFKILDDKKSEGTEGFSLLLVNPDNAEPVSYTHLDVYKRQLLYYLYMNFAIDLTKY